MSPDSTPATQLAGILHRPSAAMSAVTLLERELETARRERDDFRDRWLKQVDINDRLRADLASEKVRL